MAETKGPAKTPRTEKPRGRRKTAIGYVVSDKMQKTIDNATLGNPNWHDRANSDKCAALDHVKYALPRRDGKPDHGGWKPSPEADEGAADRWAGYT